MATTAMTKGMKEGKGYVLVDPKLIKEGRQSRHFDHSDEAINEKVNSYEKHGQLTPVTCRELGDKSLELFDGFCRLRAALKYNELFPNKPMKLKVIVTSDNGENAYVKGLVNNLSREETSVVDQAFAYKVMREEFGWSDKEIATEFKTNVTKVSQCKKLTTLREPILKMVHNKELTFENAIALSEFSESDQDQILAQSHVWLDEQKKIYEERMEAWMKDAREISATVPEPAKAEKNGEEEKTPTKPKANNAKPGGNKTKPPKPSKNQAVTKTIREKQAAAAEANGKGDKPAGKKAGRPTEKKVKPPTFLELKENVNEEFLKIQNCPEPLYTLMTLLMEYMAGKITQAEWAKDSKAESRKYEFVEKQ